MSADASNVTTGWGPAPLLDDLAALLAAADPDVLRRALTLADGLTQPIPAAALAAAVAAEDPQAAAVVLDTAVQATQETTP